MSTGLSRFARKAAMWAAAGIAVLALTLAMGFGYWLHRPLNLVSDSVELTIEPGASPREVAQRWVAAGVQEPAWLLYEWFRLSGDARRIRAGSYAATPGTTPLQLLERMIEGDELLQSVRFIEGWTFAQMREALARAPHLNVLTRGMGEAELMSALGRPGVAAEGRFFPDTYRYSKGVSDLTVLAQAQRAMQRRLEAVWAERASDLPLKTPEEALILASIVEKETGRASDRAQIAGVFVNRLRLGMPLQTDPTVIYGLGSEFDGNLRRRDLLRDTPWNTYTRNGLPPTPIAMPGMASLRAAVRPQATQALYFVARGDGSSAFSQTLEDHNRAVNQYQRGR